MQLAHNYANVCRSLLTQCPVFIQLLFWKSSFLWEHSRSPGKPSGASWLTEWAGAGNGTSSFWTSCPPSSDSRHHTGPVAPPEPVAQTGAISRGGPCVPRPALVPAKSTCARSSMRAQQQNTAALGWYMLCSPSCGSGGSWHVALPCNSAGIFDEFPSVAYCNGFLSQYRLLAFILQQGVPQLHCPENTSFNPMAPAIALVLVLSTRPCPHRQPLHPPRLGHLFQTASSTSGLPLPACGAHSVLLRASSFLYLSDFSRCGTIRCDTSGGAVPFSAPFLVIHSSSVPSGAAWLSLKHPSCCVSL